MVNARIRLPRRKACRICKGVFEPISTLQVVCSPKCAIERARAERQKKEKGDIKRQREGLKTLTQHANDTQAVVNAYIRERDRHLPCISCGRWHDGKWNAGHYRTVAAASHLRFNEDNINKQCEPCNSSRSGNVVEYRKGLIHKIGAERVETLENSNTPKKWTVDELLQIKAKYRLKLKELKKKIGG